MNLCNLRGLEDITPLYGLTGLERLWIGKTEHVPQEQLDAIRERLPHCEIDTTVTDPTGAGWREGPRYELLREQMHYGTNDYSYYWN